MNELSVSTAELPKPHELEDKPPVALPPQKKTRKPKFKVTEHVPVKEEKNEVVPEIVVVAPPLPVEVKSMDETEWPSYIKKPEVPRIPTLTKLKRARIERGLEQQEEEIKPHTAQIHEMMKVVAASAAIFGLVFFGGKFLLWCFRPKPANPPVQLAAIEAEEPLPLKPKKKKVSSLKAVPVAESNKDL